MERRAFHFSIRIAWILTVWLAGVPFSLWSQCPAGPLELQGGHCTGDTLRVGGATNASRIDWYRNGQLIKTVNHPVTPSNPIVAGGNGPGSAANQLFYPGDIFLDDKDSLFVADLGNGRIQQFPPGSTGATNGVSIIQRIFGTDGLSALDDMAGDGKGNIFIEKSGVIYKWPRGAGSGMPVATITPAYGTIPDRSDASAFCVDTADNVYVAEWLYHRVQKWAPGATSGVTVAGGNGPGEAANQLNSPDAICVDKAGNLYITDLNNHRVQKWAPGATSGIAVAGGNMKGSAANQLNSPGSVFADDAGNVFVADGFNYRVQWWAPGAVAGITVAGGNGPGSTLNQLSGPGAVYVSDDGWLYVGDGNNERIIKIALNRPPDTILAATLPGEYTALITGPDSCTVRSQPLTVFSTGFVRVGLTGAPNPVCSADSVVFTAVADTTALAFVYQWSINGAIVTDTGSVFIYRQPVADAMVSCTLTAAAVCVFGTSDTIPLQVIPSPVIVPGQVFALPYGGSMKLQPQVSGAIGSYLWTPATGISDTTARDPMADPVSTTMYTLRVFGTNGCVATAPIKVDVYIPVRPPAAFTPNGDGRNDVFYVLSGPPGLVVREMAVFDRWGHRVFQVKNAVPGDASAGWDGRLGSHSLPAGTYVYMVVMKLPDGSSQSVKGTVELIR